jgi:hypothetical protein
MTDEPVDISPYLTDEQLKAFIEYLDEDDMTHGSFWYEISFMERHGIDIAFYSGWLLGYTRLSDCPTYQEGGLPRDIVRRIALQLRDVIRREQGLPPLSDNEKRAWRFEMPYGYQQLRLPYVEDRADIDDFNPNVSSGVPDGIGSPFTDEQVAAAIDYVKTHYPEIVRYMAVVKHYRATYKAPPEYQNKHDIRMSFVAQYMSNAVFYNLKPYQKLDFHENPMSYWKLHDMIYDSL